MPIALSLTKHSNFAFSNARLQAGAAASWQCVNYSDGDQVEDARRAITQMGAWDKFVDLAFQGGAKHQALEAIAKVILCQEAAEWKVRNHYSDSLPAALSERERQAAVGRLLELSSPVGRDALLANPVVHGTNVEFSPPEGDDFASPLLRLCMPATMAVTYLHGRCTPSIYEAAANQLGEEVITPIARNQLWEAALCYQKQATYLKAAGLLERSDEALSNCAVALRSVALQRNDAADYHGSANAFLMEAKAWKILDNETNRRNALTASAQLYQRYAETCLSEDDFHATATASRSAANAWLEIGEREQAVPMWEQAGKYFVAEADNPKYRTHHGYTCVTTVARLLEDGAGAWHKAGWRSKAASLYRSAARVAMSQPHGTGDWNLASECSRKAQAIEDAAGGPGNYGRQE